LKYQEQRQQQYISVPADDPEAGGGAGGASKTYGLCQLAGLQILCFGYGFIVGSWGLVVLPAEALRMYPKRHALLYAASLSCAAVAQSLLCPFAAGYFGRRFLASTKSGGLKRLKMMLMVAAFLYFWDMVFLWAASEYSWEDVYCSLFVAGMLLLNLLYALFTAMLPAMVPEHQAAQAGAVRSCLSTLGAVVGLAVTGFCLGARDAYAAYGAVIVIGTMVTSFCIDDGKSGDGGGAAGPQKDEPVMPATHLKSMWRELTSVRGEAGGDKTEAANSSAFWWLSVVRTLHWMGSSSQYFILFFFRDVVTTTDPKLHMAIFALISLVANTACAVTMHMTGAAEKAGNNLVSVVGCAGMAVVNIAFLIASEQYLLYVLAVALGTFTGFHASVEAALVCEVLPNNRNPHDLGGWKISPLLGSWLGQLIGGVTLYHLGFTGHHEHYEFFGYVCVMLSAAVYAILAALSTAK
jgi:hypothetical protein